MDILVFLILKSFFFWAILTIFEVIVINSMNVVVGSVGLNQYTGLISPAYYALYNRDKENNIKYWHYIFQSTIFQKTLFSLGKGILFKESENGKLNTIRIKISIDTLNRVYLPLPSKKEQNQIVSFLDQETQKIDNLIAKQEKLIELLEEQRKSIISYAVTKGVNPNAKMKVSGVEWLGEVPEHWTVTAVKRLLEIPITDGPHETPEFVDDGIPFISAEAIFNSKIDFDKKRGFITSAANELYSKKYSPKLNDIYMVKSGATTGKVAIVEDSVGEDMVLQIQAGNGSIVHNPSVWSAVQQVMRKEVDAAFSDSAPLTYYANNYKDQKLRVIVDPTSPKNYYALAVAKNKPELLKQLNAGIEQVKADGTFDKIYQKWFKSAVPAQAAEASAAAAPRTPHHVQQAHPPRWVQ